MKHITRSIIIALFVALAAVPVWAQQKTDSRVERESVDRAHQELWKRFIDSHGLLLDFAGLDGAVDLPTAEECKAGKPNALGWWSPIENGGFFGGIYLNALCNRWRVTKDAASGERARRLAGGLLKLAEVGSTPGFIARGFASDGHSHYTASSSDQTYPWFYGMWSYATSDLPTPEERKRFADTMERVALGLEANGWKMPGDIEGFGNFGQWIGGFAGTKGIFSGAEPQFDAAARFLFVLRALHQVTGKDKWLKAYQARLAEKPYGSEKTRLQICAGGVQYVAPGESPRYPESPPIWTSASSQGGLRALVEMESDAAVRGEFQRGLNANAKSAARFIAGYKQYDNQNTLVFNTNWRELFAQWKPQPTIGEAVELGTLQYRSWNKISPRRKAEAEQMRDPLFAAWIVSLSGDKELIAESREATRDALVHFEWNRLYTSFFFMAESVYWQLQVQSAAK